MIRWLALLLMLLVAALLCGPAVAQDKQRAKALYAEARAAFDAERFERAAELFAQAHAAAPDPSVKYNEGFAWAEARRPARAADAYEAALADGGLSDKLAKASRERLSKLKATLGHVVIAEPTGGSISLGHVDQQPIPLSIHIAPGKHAATLHWPDGRSIDHPVDAVAGISKTVAFPEPPPRQHMPRDDVPSDANLSDEGVSGVAIAGWTLLAVGAAVGIASGVMGGLTLGAVDDYDAGGNIDPALQDDATTLKTTTNVLFAAALALGATGVVLLIVDVTADDSGSVGAAHVRLHPTGAAFEMVW